MRVRALGIFIARCGALALVAYALTRLCVELPRSHGRVAPLWVPNAVVLAFLLRTSLRNGWGLALAALAGAFAANLQMGNTPLVGFGLALCSTVEIMICRLVLHRLRPQGIDPGEPAALGLMAAVSAGASAVSITLTVAMLHWSGVLGWGGREVATPLLPLWWLANTLGLIIFTPCLLILAKARAHAREVQWRLHGAAALALYCGGLAFGFAQARYPAMFLIPPLFLLVAMELELIGAAIGIVLLSVAAVAGAMVGTGPEAFIRGGSIERMGLMQLFIGVSGLTGLSVAAMRVQQRRLREALVAAHDEARERARRATLAEEVGGVAHWRLELATDTMSWSPGMYKVFGRDPEIPVTHAEAQAAVHPDDRREISARAEQGGHEEVSANSAAFRIIRPSGETRYVTGRSVREYGPDGAVVAMFGTLIDITEQRQAEVAVAASEARFQMLAAHSSDIILRLNGQGELIYVSPSIHQVSGYSPDEMAVQTIDDTIHPDDVLEFTEAQAKLRRGELPPGTRLQHRRRRKDGSYIWLEGNPTVVFDENGAVSEIMDVIRDVTVQKALEAELQAARDAAEAASVVKSQFLSNMSHELRTPLTAVLGFSSLLAQLPDLSPTAQGYVQRLDTAGQALLSIITDVLDFSKLEAGRLELVTRAVSPAALVGDTVELFTLQAEAKGVAVAVSGLEGLPAHVTADPDRLRQILINLVGNAVKFTDAGHVRVTADYALGQLKIVVEDTGQGIPSSQRSRLFQRFSQVDGSQNRRHGGSGLGLAICKGLVEAMGGEIGVRGRRGGGSAFWFSVPAPEAHQPAGSFTAAAPPAEAAPELGLRVLVVDDHPVNRQLVRAILEPLGVDVAEADGGRKGVEIALARPFDLILMDIRMPEVDGISAMRSIRRRKGPNRAVPIVAFSAEGSEEALLPGFDGRVAKPITASGLINAVAQFAVAGSAEQPESGDRAA